MQVDLPSTSTLALSAPPHINTSTVSTTLPSLNPPLFFEIVEPQVYRCNKCDASSFPFLATLALNTVVYLSYDELSRELLEFFKERNVHVIHLGVKYRSTPIWKGMAEGMAKEAIEYILDQRRHPIMVMCKTGVHFSGTVIGCLRRLQNWSLTATIDKYRNLAGSVKTRFENEQFIELFDVDLITLPPHLPEWFVLSQQMMEEERLGLSRGEEYQYPPSQKHAEEDASADATKELAALKIDTTLDVPAFQRFYFQVQGPLTSPSVKFSEKKSIIGDDDDD